MTLLAAVMHTQHMRPQKPELALAMDYAALMEAAAAYVAVRNPSVRDPEAAHSLLRPLLTAATGGDAQESFMVILLDTKNKPIGIPRECFRGLLDTCLVHPARYFGRRSGRARQASSSDTTTRQATPPPARRTSTSPVA